MDRPFGLLAELTYRCPLACRVLLQPAQHGRLPRRADHSGVAAGAGRGPASWAFCSCHLSGGEPLLRRDLVEIVAQRRRAGPVHQPRHQRARPLAARARSSSGRPASTTCRSASRPTSPPCPTGSPAPRPSSARSRHAGVVKELGWPLTLNVVLHRQNIDRVADLLRPGRGGGGRPGRAGQHPVLRLGVAQPRRAAAEPGPARAGRDGRARRPRAAAGPDGRHLRPPRLLQPVPEALHGRLGERGSSP